jgi:hypothetical protein
MEDPDYNAADWFNYFGSYHSGICQFALADASVRSIRNTLSFQTYHRLALRQDGEPVSDF